MSESVDEQRREDAKAERDRRVEALLHELLATLKARREELPARVVADRLGRHRNTVVRRRALLDELLASIERKGIRRRT